MPRQYPRKYSYELAQEAIWKAQGKKKKTFDTKVKGASIDKGDRVLVKIVAFYGKHKISDRWETESYIVWGKKSGYSCI